MCVGSYGLHAILASADSGIIGIHRDPTIFTCSAACFVATIRGWRALLSLQYYGASFLLQGVTGLELSWEFHHSLIEIRRRTCQCRSGCLGIILLRVASQSRGPNIDPTVYNPFFMVTPQKGTPNFAPIIEPERMQMPHSATTARCCRMPSLNTSVDPWRVFLSLPHFLPPDN